MKKDIKIAIIGLGYVGLPLATEFAKKYKVIGYDVDMVRIKELKKRGYKLTSSQASGDKRPSRRPRVQASSQSLQAPGSDDQGTSAQAHDPGCKQQE